MAKKSIIINDTAHNELKKLAKGFGRNYGAFIEDMVNYFRKSGNNPCDVKNYSASEKLQNLDKRLVSFLKVQERDILKPLRQEVFDYYKKQEHLISNNQTKTIDILKQIDKNNHLRNQSILLQLEKQQKALIIISDFLDKKNKNGLISNIQNIFK
ncbi:hypothetical protein FHR24_003016 [Wenyingzhuangia heitensis]|uniref:Uncharacterized protein n=1 Tax=Wenyingzhuangia heitensis TaxID=1487859 RepID=A0ABX0UCH3_9FLAO|nr:BfmA/BtgA family mobilization protein [Wenyingzhuangia heitensis]NIJ46527.1 hypothetical protein [Wenyingzhuangia heitensis]